MSSKLSICAYIAIIDFTLFYLLILTFTMTFYFKLINVSKNFEQYCNLPVPNMTSKFYQTSTSLEIDPLTIELNTTVKVTTEAFNLSSNASVVTTQVADSITSQTITSILSKAVTLTSLTTKAATTLILAGEVGSPCNSFTDCLGGVIVGINGTYQTMDCVNDVCICNDPYTRVVYKPNYQCAIPNGNTVCQEDIQCVGTCGFSGNQKKCTG